MFILKFKTAALAIFLILAGFSAIFAQSRFLLPGNYFHIDSFTNENAFVFTADYDADGKTDIAIFRPANSTWSIQRSSDGGTTNTVFGQAADIPAVWQR